MKKKRGGNNSSEVKTRARPFKTYGFENGGTTARDDSMRALNNKNKAQNKLNQSAGSNLKCNDELERSDVVIPQFFIANPTGVINSNLLSKTGNKTNLRSISQSEFDHHAYSGGKKVKNNRLISQKKTKKKETVAKSKKTIKIKKNKKNKKNKKRMKTLKVIKN